MKMRSPGKNILFNNREKEILILFLSVFIFKVSLSQKSEQYILLEDLLNSKAPAEEISIFQMDGYPKMLFWPNDLVGPEAGIYRPDYLVKTTEGLFCLIDGTGRVYQTKAYGDSLVYIRKDESNYVGNNFQHLVFSYRDSIFSLGGYGFWRWNGLLRNFNPKSLSWNVIPLNKELVVRQHFNAPRGGHWIDYSKGNLYYVMKPYDREWLKGYMLPAAFYSDTTTVQKLDLKTKNWTRCGILTKDALDKLISAQRYGASPFGELIATLPLTEKRIYAFDYANNSIKLLASDKAILISEFLHGQKTPKGKIISYWQDSALHLRTSMGLKLDVELTEKDFQNSPIKIYAESKFNSFRIYGFLGLILIIGGFVGFYLYRLQAEKSKSKSILFDPIDHKIITTLLSRPDFSITATELNELLGASSKSDDVQRKVRSESIKRINATWSRITGVEETLIKSHRMPSDRRMVIYALDNNLYQNFESLMKNT